MKKVALFIAYKGFRDEEYLEPKKILENNGIKVITVSTEKGMASGKLGATAEVDLTVDEVNIDEYDCLALVGGPGALEYLDNEKIHKLFNDFYSKNKPVAAICISPVVLAHAGLLKGKKATVWPDGKDELIKAGAIYVEQPVVVDSNIITANGPDAAGSYGSTIVDILKN